jgi:DNA polymerase-3 subunit epsilon
MLEGAPTFSDVALEVERLLSGAVFVAHNAAFDYGFIKHEFARAGIEWSADTLCTVELSRKVFPFAIGHSLDAVIERYGIGVEERHRALPDAEAVWEFVSALDREHDPATLARLMPLREAGTRKRYPTEERVIS